MVIIVDGQWCEEGWWLVEACIVDAVSLRIAVIPVTVEKKFISNTTEPTI